jgi:hypothetical protein
LMMRCSGCDGTCGRRNGFSEALWQE